jgi:hypothetical protein
MTLASLPAAVLLAWLPGALFFRLPVGDRARRGTLDAEERVFWQVVLSVTWSLSVVLALASLEQYTFTRLIAINGVVSALLLLGGRGRLLWRGQATPLRWTALLPIALIALSLWRFFPVSEYVIGGKDPGVLLNEGVQIAQRGSLYIHDETLAAIPPFALDLFYPSEHRPDYYSSSFMGFFIHDPARGLVMGQFPHLLPATIAIGYGLDGLTGARSATAWWGILGVLAVYFLAVRLFGRGAAFAAAGLLTLHVIQVWFARYPNSDIVLQAGTFAGLLALARAVDDGDRWFGPLAAWILCLQLFNRVDALLVILVSATAVGLWWVGATGRALPRRVLLAMAVGTGVGLLYLTGPLTAYWTRASEFLDALPVNFSLAVALVAVLILLARLFRATLADSVSTWLPWSTVATLIVLALYAFFLREPGGRLTDFDAHALKNFVNLYLGGAMFLLVLVGLVTDARPAFWRHPAFVLTFGGFSLFLLYKLRIVPEHFWLARKFIAVILPGALVVGCAAAMPRPGDPRWRKLLHGCLGAVLLAAAGVTYARAAASVIPHVEYRNMIPYVEALASRFGPRDLVIMESRNSGSDIHVLGTPLAYIYAKHVVLLRSPKPDLVVFREFLRDALQKYERVFFVGTGGTALLSRHISATPVASDSVQIDEFEVTTDRLPTVVRHKEFDYGVYRMTLGTALAEPFSLDIGERDDLHVVRFHAKERSGDRTIRWTQDSSEIAVSGMTGRERLVTLVMSAGGRPSTVPPAQVEVFVGETSLGVVTVVEGFQEYRFAIPPELAAAAAQGDEPAALRLVSTMWSPQAAFGVADSRELGVMLDRVSVR